MKSKRSPNLKRIPYVSDIGPLEWGDEPLSAAEVLDMHRRLKEAGDRIRQDEKRLRAKEKLQLHLEDNARRKRARLTGLQIAEDERRQAELDAIAVEHAERDKSLLESIAYAQKHIQALAAKLDEDAAWRKQAKARLAKAQDEINRDMVSAERKVLLERGVVRGRRG